MHQLPQGGWLIDTPGMRELQLLDVAEGLDTVFSDVVEFSHQCRFSDCGHAKEPHCGVQSAIRRGDLDEERLHRYRKLQAEDRRSKESLAERHARDKSLGKFYKSVLSSKRNLTGKQQ
jgi:ribosome biogenesis GTPase